MPKRKRRVFDYVHLLEASVVGIPAYPEATLSYDFIDKKKITYRQRKKLPDSVFAIPEKRKYPIHDITHARNALARVAAFGTPAEKARVRAAVCNKYPDLPSCKKEKSCDIVPTQKELKEMFNQLKEDKKMKLKKDEESPPEEGEEKKEEAEAPAEETAEEASAEEEKTEEAPKEEEKSVSIKEVEKLIEKKIEEALKKIEPEKKGLDSTDLKKEKVEDLKFEKGNEEEFFEKVGEVMVDSGFFKA